MMDFKSKIIQEVFENKIKSTLSSGSKITFADGGKTESEVYSPREFLNEFLKIVSVEDGITIDSEIKVLENQLNEEIEKVLSKYRVNSIFMLPLDELETIESFRREIESKKMFITRAELDAYVICNPNLPKQNYVEELRYTREMLIEQGLIMLDIINGNLNYVYKWQYLSGNIQQKLSNLSMYSEKYKENLTESQYLNQISELEKIRNTYALITTDDKNKIFLSPNSFFSDDIKEFQVNVDDYEKYDRVTYPTTLKNAFTIWISDEDEIDPIKFSPSNPTSIIRYYVERDIKPQDKNDEKDKDNAQRVGQKMFDIFLNEVLNDKCKRRLEIIWNAKFNNYVEPKKYKIPIALTCAKVWKKNSNFRPNEPQVQSVQFMKEAGSGLLAYGVGVGKTASAILNMSYSFDNNLSSKALLVVPLATYRKWIGEIAGLKQTEFSVTYKENGQVKTKVFAQEKDAKKFSKEHSDSNISVNQVESKGILPHIKNVIGLENLNKEVVFSIKDYTEKEKKEIADGEDLLIYLSKIAKDYNFTDPVINKEIKNRYGDFELDYFLISYNAYVRSKEEKKQKTQPMLSWFMSSVKNYVNNLYYRLGKLKERDGKTIYVLTIEGLKRLGVENLSSEDRSALNSDDSLISKIYGEIRQGDSFSRLQYNNKTNRFAEELEIDMYGGVGEQKIFLKELGIDYVVFDESHYFKKSFVSIKGKPKNNPITYKEDGGVERFSPVYDISTGNEPSKRALSSYIVTRYVQENNNYNNVIHLTATPFTNSPLEVYSMMALTNYKRLVDAGYRNLQDFFDTFMRITYELRIETTGVDWGEVLSGYNNAPQLRTLIYSMMDYKNGDDANIQRPNKIMYPSVSKGRDMIMIPSQLQAEYFGLIKGYMNEEFTMEQICYFSSNDEDVEDMSTEKLIEILETQKGYQGKKDKFSEIELPLSDADRKELESIITEIIEIRKESLQDEKRLTLQEKDKVRIIKGLNMLKQVTLTPYLFSCKKKDNIEPNYKEYVETSPKLLYTVNAIKSIKDFEVSRGLRRSGSVIYMNLGVHPSVKVLQDNAYVQKKWQEGGFEKIKKYLVKELGYSENEISIVSGGGNNEEKEKEKNKFLSGESTVIIGSSTISTGVDLQDNASTLFITSFDWNPTDAEQVSGRIHRQGNRFANVRIVYPMVENSSDPVIFQTLQEKTMRIKEIWDREGKKGELDLTDFDPTLLKEMLLTDPKSKTKIWKEKHSREIEDEIQVLTIRLTKTLQKAGTEYSNINDLREQMRALLIVWDAYRKNKDKQELIAKVSEKTKGLESEFNEVKSELLLKLQEDEDFAPKYSEELKKAKSVYEKGVQDAKKGIYDFETDPDNRYVLEDFSNYSDEEILNKLNSVILSTGSAFYKRKENESGFNESLNSFININYPNFYEGKYASDEMLKSISNEVEEIKQKQIENRNKVNELDRAESSLKSQYNYNFTELEKNEDYINILKDKELLLKEYQDFNKILTKLDKKYKSYNNYRNRLYFSSWSGSYSNAVTFRDAMRIFDKLKQQLAIIGVKADDIQSAQDEINDQISAKRDELTNIEKRADEMFLIFQKEYEERKTTAPTVLEKVDEFADANDEYLTKFLNPIVSQIPKLNVTEDKTIKEVEPIVIEKITKDITFVEPKKKVEPKGKIIKVIDTSKMKPKKSKNDLEFLHDKLEATQDLIDVLEMTDGDSKDLEYLKSLLETTKDLISLMELA